MQSVEHRKNKRKRSESPVNIKPSNNEIKVIVAQVVPQSHTGKKKKRIETPVTSPSTSALAKSCRILPADPIYFPKQNGSFAVLSGGRLTILENGTTVTSEEETQFCTGNCINEGMWYVEATFYHRKLYSGVLKIGWVSEERAALYTTYKEYSYNPISRHLSDNPEEAYGSDYVSKDVIGTLIQLHSPSSSLAAAEDITNSNNIAYFINGKFQGVAFNGIPKNDYHFCITMPSNFRATITQLSPYQYSPHQRFQQPFSVRGWNMFFLHSYQTITHQLRARAKLMKKRQRKKPKKHHHREDHGKQNSQQESSETLNNLPENFPIPEISGISHDAMQKMVIPTVEPTSGESNISDSGILQRSISFDISHFGSHRMNPSFEKELMINTSAVGEVDSNIFEQHEGVQSIELSGPVIGIRTSWFFNQATTILDNLSTTTSRAAIHDRDVITPLSCSSSYSQAFSRSSSNMSTPTEVHPIDTRFDTNINIPLLAQCDGGVENNPNKD